MFFAANSQRDDMRGGVAGDTAFEVCYRHMHQQDLPQFYPWKFQTILWILSFHYLLLTLCVLLHHTFERQ